MKSTLVLIFGILVAHSAFAAGAPGSGGFNGAVALSGGLGQMKDDQGSIPKADMLFTEATLQLGYRIGMIAPMIQLGYRYLGQTTDPDQVSGNNLGGSGYTAGAGFDVVFTKTRIAAIYNLEGKYDLTKESSGGAKVSYDKVSGFHLLFGYNWRPSWEVFLTASQIQFKQKTTGGAISDLGTNPLAQTLFGAGISYLF